MLVASVLLILIAIAMFVGNVVLSGLGLAGPGVSEMIYAPVPWFLLGTMAVGCVLGVLSLIRHRSASRYVLIAAEIALSSSVAFLFLVFTQLPEHHLKLSAGDLFPSYTLFDQDGVSQIARAGAPRNRGLYIFYRGDW